MALSKDKKKALDGALAAISKRFGGKVADYASNKKEELQIVRVLSPCNAFNNMLYGGLVKGKVTEFAGENSTGKTNMAVDIIVENQKRDPNFVAAWCETEQSMSEESLEAKGVDMDRLIYWGSEELNAENSLEVLRGLIASGQIDLFVLNSVTGMRTEKEESDDLNQQNMALIARLMSKLFRVIIGPADKAGCTCIFINQLRDNIGGYSGAPVTTGGKALGFYASQRVWFSSPKLQSKVDPITEEEGKKIVCRVKKNRFANGNNPYTMCEYFVSYDINGIDNLITMPQDLLNSGVLYKKNPQSPYQLLDPNGNVYEVNGFKYQWRGKKALVDDLRNNPQLVEYFNGLLQGKVDRDSIKTLSKEEIDSIQAEDKMLEEAGKELQTQN